MLDYIRSLLAFIFAISVMYMLLDCEIKHQKNRYLLGLYVTILLICNVLVLYNFGYIFFMKLYPLLVHFPVFLAFVFVSRFKPIKVFFVLCTLIAFSTSFSVVGLIISYFFGSSREVVNIVSYMLFIPTGLIIYQYIRPSFLYMMRNTDKGWLGFSIVPLSYSVLIYSIGMYNLDTVNIGPLLKNAVLLFILAFSAYYMIIRFFKQTQEQLTLQTEQDLLIKQATAAQHQLAALQESQEMTIIYRHDMRHHLNLISAYLAENNPAAAQNYINEVEKTIASAVVEKYCSNYTVNLILYFYIAKAKDALIAVETQIDLREQNPVSDMDLCVIFANALENAMNACQRIPNANDRCLKIFCQTKSDKLFIQIANSYTGTVTFDDDMPVSTEENHGLGTKSIAAVAHKYDGLFSFTAEDGIFKTNIIL